MAGVPETIGRLLVTVVHRQLYPWPSHPMDGETGGTKPGPGELTLAVPSVSGRALLFPGLGSASPPEKRPLKHPPRTVQAATEQCLQRDRLALLI